MTGPTAPAYGQATLSDLMPSVLASLAVAGAGPTRLLPETPRCVVLLVDGLGRQLLRRHADAAPFLTSLDARTLSTGYPSTTATSLTSIGTGLPPGEHGITGYTTWLEEVDETIAWLSWTSARDRSDLRDRVVPEALQPRQTVFERAADDGVAVTVAAPFAFRDSGLTRAAQRGAHYPGAFTPGDTVAQAVHGSRAGSRSLVYCYTADLDLTGHVRGVGSEAWSTQLRLVDRFAEELAGRLPADALLVVTGDHGMVDVSAEGRVDVDVEPALQAGVRHLAGEPRARSLHCVPGAVPDVVATWTEVLGDRMWVGRADQAVAAGLLGPTVTAGARSRIGDVLAVATGDVAVVQSRTDPVFAGMVGHHGALTDEERLVPLLTAAR